eukprot:3423397-Amphidinium_carterae.1
MEPFIMRGCTHVTCTQPEVSTSSDRLRASASSMETYSRIVWLLCFCLFWPQIMTRPRPLQSEQE